MIYGQIFKSKIIFWLAAALFIGNIGIVRSQTVPTYKNEFNATDNLPVFKALVDSIIEDEMQKEFLPGVVFVAVKDGKIVMAQGYGYANLEQKIPVSPEKTIFRIGSISKVFTAMGIVQLADTHRINLDDDVNKYLTRPKVDNRYSEPVRFWHLLTHTGGFDQIGDRSRNASTAADRKPLADYLENTLIRIRPPGQVSCYDTWGMSLAGRLIEEISGDSYAGFMKRNIFTPLHMDRTNVEVPESLKNNLAIGYGYRDGKYVPQNYEYYATTPAASIDATALDMAQFMIAVLGDGSSDGRKAFLSKRAIQQFKKPQFTNYPGIPAFSYGFWDDNRNDQQVIHHGGIMLGYTSEMYLIPESNLGFFVAYNRDREAGGPPAELRQVLIKKLMDFWFPPKEKPVVAPPAPLPVKTERFAGNYAGNMYCHTCHEGEGWTMFYTPVKSAGDGVLEIDGNRWIMVEPLVFQAEKTGEKIAFRADKDGRITHLIAKNYVREKLDERLIEEVLGADWRNKPVAPLTALVYRTNEEWGKAALAYEEIAAQRPHYGRAFYNAGVCWLRSKKPEPALVALKKAWELNERRPQTAYRIAVAYTLTENKDSAFEWLNNAVGAGFTDKEQLKSDPNLSLLRSDPRFNQLLERFDKK